MARQEIFDAIQSLGHYRNDNNSQSKIIFPDGKEWQYVLQECPCCPNVVYGSIQYVNPETREVTLKHIPFDSGFSFDHKKPHTMKQLRMYLRNNGIRKGLFGKRKRELLRMCYTF